jgi:hypothetical protein
MELKHTSLLDTPSFTATVSFAMCTRVSVNHHLANGRDSSVSGRKNSQQITVCASWGKHSITSLQRGVLQMHGTQNMYLPADQSMQFLHEADFHPVHKKRKKCKYSTGQLEEREKLTS